MIRVDEIGDTWVKLLWSKPADHNSPILSYTIQTRHFWALNEDDWRDASTCKCCFLPVGGQVALQFGITGASGLLQPTSKNVLTQFNMVFVSPSAPAFLDGSLEKAEVTDLYPWMEYQFRIIATNEHGSGEASIPSLKIKTWDAGKEKILIFDIFSQEVKRKL